MNDYTSIGQDVGWTPPIVRALRRITEKGTWGPNLNCLDCGHAHQEDLRHRSSIIYEKFDVMATLPLIYAKLASEMYRCTTGFE